MNIKKSLLFLSFILFITFNAASQTIAPSADQKLYTKQDIKFELLIPNAKPNTVQILTPTLPFGVTLKTLRKTEQYGEVTGTLVELWFSFDKTGTYELPRLSVLVQNRRKYYYFEEVKITENPANMLPKIIVEFSNGVTISSDDPAPKKALFSTPAGKKISFKVNLQYSTQLVQFHWDIPKDSIFTQTKTYEFTEIKYREKNYSSELIPIADFEWTPLSKGTNSMPKLKLTATGYSGYRNELTLPNITINVTGNTSSKVSKQEYNGMFDSAFEVNEDDLVIEEHKEITLEHCQKIIELRHSEHYNFFDSFKYKKQREELEEELSLSSNSDEFYLGFLYISIILLVISAVLLVLMIKKHMSVYILTFSVLIILSLSGLIYSISMDSRKYGISAGCTLQSIPEENASTIGTISIGNRVKIIEKTNDWYFVELGTINGWTKASEILE